MIREILWRLKRCVFLEDALLKYETNRFEFVFILFIFTVQSNIFDNTLHLGLFTCKATNDTGAAQKIADTFYGACSLLNVGFWTVASFFTTLLYFYQFIRFNLLKKGINMPLTYRFSEKIMVSQRNGYVNHCF